MSNNIHIKIIEFLLLFLYLINLSGIELFFFFVRANTAVLGYAFCAGNGKPQIERLQFGLQYLQSGEKDKLNKK
jgi:hypothetical protein